MENKNQIKKKMFFQRFDLFFEISQDKNSLLKYLLKQVKPFTQVTYKMKVIKKYYKTITTPKSTLKNRTAV